MMNSLSASPWIVSAAAAAERLGEIRELALAAPHSARLHVAHTPTRRGRRAPPLLLLVGSRWLGPAIEMTRLLAGSREVRRCAVACLETTALDAALLRDAIVRCRQQLRVDNREVAVFAETAEAPQLLAAFASGASGAAHCIVVGNAEVCAALTALTPAQAAQVACTVTRMPADAATGVRWKLAPESVAAGLALPALIHGLRQFWGRKDRYGDDVMPLTRELAADVLERIAPLLRPLTGRARNSNADTHSPLIRSQVLGRDFEVFVAVPDLATHDEASRWPTVLALDGNAGFASVAAIAASLIANGQIEPCIVVGIGTPRSEGELEFGYRRFEELSPPASPELDWRDPLSCCFRALYALRGQDARRQLGKAPGLYRFLVDELLPLLCRTLPVDRDALHLLGHSAAGTFVAYAMSQPDAPFCGYACLSPGVAISGNWMMHNARIAPQAMLYSALGSEELENEFNRVSGIPRTPEFIEKLRTTGARVPPCEILDGESHTTVYPRAVAQALRGLLPADH